MLDKLLNNTVRQNVSFVLVRKTDNFDKTNLTLLFAMFANFCTVPVAHIASSRQN